MPRAGRHPYVGRSLVVRRRLRLEADHRVVLVVGPRQAGKSTLIWHTLASGGRPVLYLNCEEPSVRTWLRSPALFLADLEELAPGVPVLFFEEVQALPEAGLFLKGLVDHKSGKEIYATGSSSFDLEAETRESLAGRARRHLLLPLSLSEIAADGPRAVGGGQRGAALGRLERAETVEQALIFGSYPSVHGAARPEEELAALVESYIVRDASDRFRIRHLAALRKLLALAASQVDNLCNFSEWGALAGISQDTVAEYCRLLEETHVLRLIRPFIGGKRAELTKTPKVFFVDNNGIRNQLFGGFAPASGRADRGALVENLVFSELAKNTNPLLDSIRYWRSKSKAEVDFVVEHQGRVLACEVKAGDARSRISRSVRSFLDAYRPLRFLIVHSGARETVEVGKNRVEFLALSDLEAAVRDFVGG